MPFERYVPPKRQGSEPRATIRPTGLISFDAASVEQFGLDKASHAVLFFDTSRKLVGLKPTKDAKEEGALKVSKRRRSVSVKAPDFFEQYALTFEKPQRFEVAREGDYITISLKDVRRRRGRRPKAQR